MILNNARDLNDLRVPPGNRLEASPAIGRASTVSASTTNGDCCFVWRNGDAYQVELVDYH